MFAAKEASHARFTLTDLERQSLEIAKENLTLNGITNTEVKFYKWGPEP